MTTFTHSRYVIAVKNLKISADYYKNVLGFEIRESGDPGWLFFSRGNCHIMAGECPDAISAKETGPHSYFAYMQLSDVDAYFDEISGKGAELLKNVRDEVWGMREFGVRTVDGHRIMFGTPIANS